MSLESRPLRWGLIGCGNISNDFAIALSTLPKEEHVIQHVAARDVNRASEFAKRFNAASFSGSYEELVKDENVDVVYVGTIHPTHAGFSMLALNHGKHVLCEKPSATNLKELNEVLNLAKEKNLFFMEGMWTAHFPVWRDIISKLNSENYGEVKVCQISFGVSILMQVDRIAKKELGGGVLSDIGVYTLAAADLLFRGEAANKIVATGYVDPTLNVDRSESVTLLYGDNKTAQLLNDGDHSLPNKVFATCANGMLEIEQPFWSPEKYLFKYNDGRIVNKEFPLPSADKTVFTNSVGLRYEAAHVRDCLIAKKLESDIVSHAMSLRVMGYMDESLRQLGCPK